METKYCTKCGAEMPLEATACPACGTACREEPAAKPAAKTEPKALINKFGSFAVAAVACVLSLIMLILAFTPIFTLKGENEDLQIKFSAFQNAGFAFDAMLSQDEEEIYDSALYEKYEDLAKELSEMDVESYDDLNAREKRVYNQFAVVAMRLEMRSEDFPVRPAMLISALLSIVWVLAALALFAASVVYLLSTLVVLGSAGEKAAALVAPWASLAQKAFVWLLCGVPVLLYAVFASMYMTFGTLGYGVDTTLTGSGKAIVVLGLIALAFVVALKVWERALRPSRELLKRGLACLCALILMLLTMAPVLTAFISIGFNSSTKVKTQSTTLDASVFANWYFTSDMKELYEVWDDAEDGEKEEFLYNDFSMYQYYSRNEVKRGEADAISAGFLYTAGVMGGYYHADFVFGFITVLYTLFALGAAVLLWSRLVLLVTGEEPRLAGKIGGFVAAGAIVLALLLLAVFLVLTWITLAKYLDCQGKEAYVLLPGAGIIFAVLFAAINLFFPRLSGLVDKISIGKKQEETTV